MTQHLGRYGLIAAEVADQRRVMRNKEEISRDAETDHCAQLASVLLMLAEKELSAFITAVNELFGAEQARQSAVDWIEELKLMDWPAGESIPDWRQATLGAGGRTRQLGVRGFQTDIRRAY
jgi:hypothetical protein